MSFSYNANTWVPKTTEEHANDIMTNINTILTQNSITPLLSPNMSNPIWIQILAVAQMRAELDQQLYAGTASFNISVCDDNQILNLLPIAGTSLIPGSYSTVVISVTATEDGNCVIPLGATLTFSSNISFSTVEELTVLAGETGTVNTICNVKGNITVLAGQLTSFSGSYTNLASVTNLAISVNGSPDETVAQCRQRLLKGKTIENNIDGVVRALRSLVGINDAMVYFNYDPVNTLTLPGGKTVPPRYARIFIFGNSDLIAETFMNRLILPTPNLDTPSSQIYTGLTGQEITVYYNTVSYQDVYVKIFVPADVSLTDAQVSSIKTVVLGLNSTVKIGQVISEKLIDEQFIDFTIVDIMGCQISADGDTWSNYMIINADQVAQFSAENITVEAVS